MNRFRTSRRRTSRRGRRLAAAVLATSLAASVAATAGTAEAKNQHVSHTYFGMHDGSLESLDTLDLGSIRLWDTGVQWRQVETSKGHYDWTRLDQIVSAAQAAHVKVTMVLAMTPPFYAKDPTKAPRKISFYKNYVRAVMKRYKHFHGKRGIDAYQVWNEANVVNFWSGSPRQMAKMTQAVDQVRDQVDPKARVIAPPMTTRFLSQLGWMQRYDKQRIGGKPVWKYYDTIALNLYPQAKYGKRNGIPEDAMTLLALARKRLGQVGVPTSKPIWNTEVNYGLKTGTKGGHSADRIPQARQTSNLLRTYILNAAFGVDKVFWYRYDLGNLPRKYGAHPIGNTVLSNPDNPAKLTKTGKAYLLLQEWLHGTMVGKGKTAPCIQDVKGTYTCTVKDSKGVRHLYWNPTRKATVKLPGNAKRKQTMYGATSKVSGGSRIAVDYRPVMVDGKRP